jgi:hypothetical protein
MASAGREVSSPATARLRQALCQRLDGMKIRNGFFLKKRIRPVLSAPVYHQRTKRPSSTGYGEKSFLDLCQSEVLDHIQVEMRQVRQLI